MWPICVCETTTNIAKPKGEIDSIDCTLDLLSSVGTGGGGVAMHSLKSHDHMKYTSHPLCKHMTLITSCGARTLSNLSAHVISVESRCTCVCVQSRCISVWRIWLHMSVKSRCTCFGLSVCRAWVHMFRSVCL